MRALLLLLLCAVSVQFSIAQQVGSISGAATMNPGEVTVPGAKITLLKSNTAFARMATNEDGFYEFKNVPYGSYQLVFTLPLQDTLRYDIVLNTPKYIQDIIIGETQEVKEIRVIGNLVRGQNVPVAVTKIDTKKITEELASRDLPMLLNGTPGV
jgi:outer membrane receptor for ferrienterochelin and colicins